LRTRDNVDRLRVVLVRTRNPLNIGAAARSMSNFGFAHLRLVNPYEAGFREARSAVGASGLLVSAEVYRTVSEAVADCALVVGTTSVGPRQLQHPVKPLALGASLVRKLLASRCVALLFGSEKTGLRNEDLSHCHWLLRIPTQEQHRSMNLAQAVAICLYELVRNDNPPRPRGKARAARMEFATAGAQERLTTAFVEALQSSGYLKTSSAAGQQKIRRLIRRLAPNSDDAETLLGMVRHILWKLRATTGE
jgi:TrmH family RNA methyltransferase